MLDSKNPLVVLADTINWAQFDDSFEKYYSDNSRSTKPIRVMVGLQIFKHLEDLSDVQMVNNLYSQESKEKTSSTSVSAINQLN